MNLSKFELSKYELPKLCCLAHFYKKENVLKYQIKKQNKISF